MNSVFYFDIDDELFSGIKQNFNVGINEILAGMQKKNVYEGELALSVKISLAKTMVTDANGEEKEIVVPMINHKAVTKMSVKNKAEGRIEGFDGRDFLAVKKLRGKYIAVRTPKDASQLTLDDQRILAGLEEEMDDA